jgi:hypothetical protein
LFLKLENFSLIFSHLDGVRGVVFSSHLCNLRSFSANCSGVAVFIHSFRLCSSCSEGVNNPKKVLCFFNSFSEGVKGPRKSFLDSPLEVYTLISPSPSPSPSQLLEYKVIGKRFTFFKPKGSH